MNLEQREVFRITLLQVLDLNSTRWGLDPRKLSVHLFTRGFQVTAEEVIKELEYLEDPAKAWAAPVDKLLSPEIRCWKITAKGRDFLAERGL